jgi:hypothetical protein
MPRKVALPPKIRPVPHGPVIGGLAHAYASPACWHGQHQGCDRTCHYCGAACHCPCHGFRHEGREGRVA